MYKKLENAYVKEISGIEIMAIFTGNDWEIYYKKTGYPFMYAFGLPAKQHTSDVFNLAEENLDNYMDMFN